MRVHHAIRVACNTRPPLQTFARSRSTVSLVSGPPVGRPLGIAVSHCSEAGSSAGVLPCAAKLRALALGGLRLVTVLLHTTEHRPAALVPVLSALKGLVAGKRLPQAEAAVVRKALAVAEQKREKRKGAQADEGKASLKKQKQ